LAPFPPLAEGCQSFTEPNLSTLLYKSKYLTEKEGFELWNKDREKLNRKKPAGFWVKNILFEGMMILPQFSPHEG